MHSGYEQMKSLSCVQNCELSLCVSNIVSAHQHVGLTRGLEHSGVWHGLGHDVPPDPVHLVGEIIIILFNFYSLLSHLIKLPALYRHLLHDVLAVEDRLEVQPGLLTA